MNRNNTIALATFLLCSLPCSAVSVSIWKASDAPCGQSLGYLTAEVSGGTGPYTYL